MLKLLIHEETRQILGVHAVGTGATELIHIGQAVIAFQGTVDYFINSVFNYPTLAECYKVAALNGSNKLRLLGPIPAPLPAANGRFASPAPPEAVETNGARHLAVPPVEPGAPSPLCPQSG